MNTSYHPRIKFLITWFILFVILTGCVRRQNSTSTQVLPSTPTEDVNGLSTEAAATLRNLEKLHDYPFYVMQYSGDYQYPRIGLSLQAGRDISCSLFVTLGTAGDMFYGRNFDWDYSPALLLFTDPPGGYASVSMVDLTFLGIDPDSASTLTDLPLSERTALLAAPSMSFDGMNEYGLTIGMAAVPDEFEDDASYETSRSSIGSIGIIRQVLDHAQNVDEALDIFAQYNINFGGGPPIHYLVADRSGKAVLIEFYQSEMVVLPNEGPWHLATNHLRCIADGDGGCPRYRTISARLSALNGQLDSRSSMQLLSDVKQSATQWSAVYNMSTGDVNVVIAQRYDQVYSFHLALMPP